MKEFLADKSFLATRDNLSPTKVAIAPRLLVFLITFITIHSLPVFNPPHPLFKFGSIGKNSAIASNDLIPILYNNALN